MNPTDSLAIHELMNRYAYALDQHDMDGLKACFVETASFSISIHRQKDGRTFEGRDAIMALFRDAADAQTDRRRHIITNTFVDFLGKGEAKVFSNLTLLSIDGGSLTPLTCGIYRDVVSSANGRWQIVNRELSLDLPY